MIARLTIHLPRQPTKTVLLRGGETYLVGRDPACDVVLEDGRVSREHARFSGAGDGLRISNLGSKNGLTLDGRPVEESVLNGACLVGFGGVIAEYEPLRDDGGWALERRRKLETTLHAHHQLERHGRSVDTLIERLLASVIEIGGAERGFVLLATAGGDFEIVASSGLEPAELARHEFRGSVSAVNRVLETGAPIAESDVLDDTYLGARRSVVTEGIRGLICLPLATGGRSIGAIYADSRREGAAFDQLDLEILGALASHAALSLWVAGLDRELRSLAGNLPTEVGGAASGVRGIAAFPAWSSLAAESLTGSEDSA